MRRIGPDDPRWFEDDDAMCFDDPLDCDRCPHCDDEAEHRYTRELGSVCPLAPAATLTRAA